MIPIIDVRNLGKRVADATGELTILDDVNLAVNAGETLAIVGASGSGKSTLLGILAGLDTPTSGTVKLAQTDIFALDEDGRAVFRQARLGFVFQSFQLLSHLTALENVMLPLELRGDADARTRAEAMLDRVGLSSRLKHYPKYLSGGEQQRVALARAFVAEPPLLFADEPTGSLDAATGEAVMRLMFALNRERGSTLVLVTHDPAIAARCGRTVTMAAGRLDRAAKEEEALCA
ncbi:ABC transporter ATP-binding protein [Pseudoduganella namucuonensis]|uniref:Putative ABC transport system ATP-binding protein n=1 Tax=Pseudoduganella namucuonensis TaxID=1035707 RepID=A0A1I7I2W7_9BURK|nr:ABC transporter ATP-binding protein [Pseudoduganella namucuonensis]SFU67292.1 putative ABC transport system ATP-binding protein [Pseudoduganella namucuonensis]